MMVVGVRWLENILSMLSSWKAIRSSSVEKKRLKKLLYLPSVFRETGKTIFVRDDSELLLATKVWYTSTDRSSIQLHSGTPHKGHHSIKATLLPKCTPLVQINPRDKANPL